MISKKPLVVYWAPDIPPVTSGDQFDWSLSYVPPYSLYKEVVDNVNKDNPGTSMLACPAFKGMSSNMFILSSTGGIDYTYDKKEQVFKNNLGENFIGLRPNRLANMNDRAHLAISFGWFFFCEEPLEFELTSPYFSDAPHLSQGSIVPGSFDISKWFRPINAEFVLKSGVTRFAIAPYEPMAYLKLKTDRKIVFKRFIADTELCGIASTCTRSSLLFGSNLPLIDRYSQFLNTGTNKKVLYHIKKNLVD